MTFADEDLLSRAVEACTVDLPTIHWRLRCWSRTKRDEEMTLKEISIYQMSRKSHTQEWGSEKAMVSEPHNPQFALHK